MYPTSKHRFLLLYSTHEDRVILDRAFYVKIESNTLRSLLDYKFMFLYFFTNYKTCQVDFLGF